MATPLPSAIHVEAVRDTVRYMLPLRSLGKYRWFGLIPLIFSVCFLAVPLTALLHFLAEIISGQAGTGNWMAVIFLAAFTIVGSFPFLIGVLIVWGRCKVDWRAGHLTVTDFAGPLRWRRRLPKSPVRKFTVSSGGVKVNDRPVTSGPLAEAGTLTAEFADASPRIVLIGYPRAWLQAVAEDLSARIGVTEPTMNAPAVAVVRADSENELTADVIEKPTGSQVRAEPRANGGVLLVVPPAGLRKGTRGLFVFALLWCSFMVFFTTMVAIVDIEETSQLPWFAWIVIVVFWLVGFGLLASAINMGRRRAMVLAENGRLVVAQQGPFGSKRREWAREEISAIRADASGMEVNDVPVNELQIHPSAGRKAGFFSGRDDAELRWMANELRRALNVPAE